MSSLRVTCVQLEAADVQEHERALREAASSAAEAASKSDLVILPEATYPGYVLGSKDRFADRSWFDRGRSTFAGIASKYRCWVVVGLVRWDGSRLMNSSVLFDAQGEVSAVTDKSFLWHFDSKWFDRGTRGDVFDLPWGPAGMVVCADIRMMEIPRTLAVLGARLIIDPTALVLSPAGSNAQIEYMLEARARENGCFIAVANKCGAEAGVAHYAGRSAIYGPDGSVVAQAGQDGPALVTAEIDLQDAGGPSGRRPERYRALVSETASQSRSDSHASGTVIRIAIDHSGTSSDDFSTTGADLLVRVASDGDVTEFVRGLDGEVLSVGEDALVSFEGAMIGLVPRAGGAVPEEARSLVLGGAQILIFRSEKPLDASVMRTRADENRVFVIALGQTGDWAVYSPMGTLIARGPDPSADLISIEFDLALTLRTEVVPGTDVIAGRHPSEYAPLVV